MGVSENDITIAFDDAEAHLDAEAKRLNAEANELERLRKASRAPGAKTIGEGLRQRAKTGDKDAIEILAKLGR
jgi:hypothetical protein